MPKTMTEDGPDLQSVLKAIEAVTAQLAALNARVEKMEKLEAGASAAQAEQQTAVATAAFATPVAATAPAAEESTGVFDEETLLAVSAAIAAYLGKRPRIRAIRLVNSGAWAQQGRVFVQASHRLNVPHEN